MTSLDQSRTTSQLVVGDGRWSVADREDVITPAARLAADVRDGLWQDPPTLPARWFYDERGSILFDEITRLPEYYPTRRETEILTAHADDIVKLTGATTMVELGSGTSEKTRLLLDAFGRVGSLTFVPIDVSVEVLTHAARTIASDFPSVTVQAVVGDFDEPFDPLPGEPGTRLIAFLGSTIGNFTTDSRSALFERIRDALAPGDHFLVGADLKKDPKRLVAAYDDSAGVTAAFNRNLIDVLRRELDADGLDGNDFTHIARWNADRGRIEMWLRAARPVRARFRKLDLDWELPAGGEMLTEISVKFELPRLHAELVAAGFEIAESWTDAADDFSLTLAVAT